MRIPNLVIDDGPVRVYHGDCLQVLQAFPDSSVQAVVTDPPYGLSFMGKAWDKSWIVSSVGFAGRDSLRLPRFGDQPNATCLTCGGRQRGARRCSCPDPDWDQPLPSHSGSYQRWCERWARECLRLLTPGGHMTVFGGTRTWHRLAAAIEDAGFEIRNTIAWLYGQGFPKSRALGELGPQCQGWGTGLKPAFEPIIVARRPPAGAVTSTVRRFATGALHIDACRVPARGRPPRIARDKDTPGKATYGNHGPGGGSYAAGHTDQGRWPPNVLLTHSASCRKVCSSSCPVAALNDESGTLHSGANPARRHSDIFRDCYGRFTGHPDCKPARGANSGGAARFFPSFRWQAKARRAERPRAGTNTHPTVKPLELMRWLVRLVTPEGGLVLDPFLGSGSTAEACRLEEFRCIGIEREAEYLPLIPARLARRPA